MCCLLSELVHKLRSTLSLTYNASLFVYYKRLIYRPMAYTRWIELSGVRKLFGFLGCLRSSKFGFGLNWDVRKCSKFDLNVWRTLQTFGEQYFFSILLFEHTFFVNVQSQKNFTFSNKQFFCLKKIETENLVKNSSLIESYRSSMFGIACSKFGLEIQESCSKCSNFGVSMFEVFNVRYFGVRSTSSIYSLVSSFS